MKVWCGKDWEFRRRRDNEESSSVRGDTGQLEQFETWPPAFYLFISMFSVEEKTVTCTLWHPYKSSLCQRSNQSLRCKWYNAIDHSTKYNGMKVKATIHYVINLAIYKTDPPDRIFNVTLTSKYTIFLAMVPCSTFQSHLQVPNKWIFHYFRLFQRMNPAIKFKILIED